ncbi:MAG: hypothetical protein ABI222_03940 [Opitutaceae bacterium]
MHSFEPAMPALPVIPMMVIIGICLVFTFALFFLCDRSRRFSDAARESLLPLDEETPHILSDEMGEVHMHDHDHDHDHGCGCKSGRRAPCPGCLKRHETFTA